MHLVQRRQEKKLGEGEKNNQNEVVEFTSINVNGLFKRICQTGLIMHNTSSKLFIKSTYKA